MLNKKSKIRMEKDVTRGRRILEWDIDSIVFVNDFTSLERQSFVLYRRIKNTRRKFMRRRWRKKRTKKEE